MSNPFTRRIGLIAATAVLSAAGLIAPSAPAQAATPPTPLGTVTVSGLPAEIAVPFDGTWSASTVVPLTVSFSGEPTDKSDANQDGWTVAYGAFDGEYYSAKVETVDAHTQSPYRPTIESPAAVDANTPATYNLKVEADTTPGRYRITIPITQGIGGKANNYSTTRTTQAASLEFNVIANTQAVYAQTGYSMRGKFSKKSKWTGSANLPDYMVGATVKVYYKAKGKKKYSVVATGKLNASGDTALKTKKGAIRKKGDAYLSVGAVAYVPAFATKAVKVK